MVTLPFVANDKFNNRQRKNKPMQQRNHIPKWLDEAVASRGGRALCETEVFQSPDGTWAVWVWKDEDMPILSLPSQSVAERVAEALHEAYREGGEGDYYYD